MNHFPSGLAGGDQVPGGGKALFRSEVPVEAGMLIDQQGFGSFGWVPELNLSPHLEMKAIVPAGTGAGHWPRQVQG